MADQTIPANPEDTGDAAPVSQPPAEAQPASPASDPDPAAAAYATGFALGSDLRGREGLDAEALMRGIRDALAGAQPAPQIHGGAPAAVAPAAIPGAIPGAVSGAGRAGVKRRPMRLPAAKKESVIPFLKKALPVVSMTAALILVFLYGMRNDTTIDWGDMCVEVIGYGMPSSFQSLGGDDMNVKPGSRYVIPRTRRMTFSFRHERGAALSVRLADNEVRVALREPELDSSPLYTLPRLSAREGIPVKLRIVLGPDGSTPLVKFVPRESWQVVPEGTEPEPPPPEPGAPGVGSRGGEPRPPDDQPASPVEAPRPPTPAPETAPSGPDSLAPDYDPLGPRSDSPPADSPPPGPDPLAPGR